MTALATPTTEAPTKHKTKGKPSVFSRLLKAEPEPEEGLEGAEGAEGEGAPDEGAVEAAEGGEDSP